MHTLAGWTSNINPFYYQNENSVSAVFDNKYSTLSEFNRCIDSHYGNAISVTRGSIDHLNFNREFNRQQ